MALTGFNTTDLAVSTFTSFFAPLTRALYDSATLRMLAVSLPSRPESVMEYQGLKALFSCEVPTRWGDQDIYRHINNVSYFRYFEEARVRWFEQLGFGVESGDTGPVIVHTSATYLKPILYPTVIIVRCYIGEPGRSSLPMLHTLSTTDDPDTIYTEGFVKNVWIDHASGKSVPLPPALLTKLGVGKAK